MGDQERINTRQIGSKEESRASLHLENLGYKILHRNWHWGKRGEIDIVALDPNRYGKEFLIFVEVKYRRWSMDMSLHALSHSKIQQLKRLATIYMERHGYHHSKTPVSFDFVAISGDKLKHIKNIVS